VRVADIAGLAFSALYQQKVRTVLTTLGVVIGSFVLLLSLSIGQGVREVIAAEWRRNDQLRRINVWPGSRRSEASIPEEDIAVKGEMSDARRERLRQALIRHWSGKPKQDTAVYLTPGQLQELAAIDHVAAVVPFINWYGVRAYFKNKTQRLSVASAEAGDPRFDERLVAGSFFTPDQPRGVVVTEYLLYQLGVTDEADLSSVPGQRLRLEFSSQPFRSGTLLWLLGGEAPRLTPADEDVLGRVSQQLPGALAHLDLTPADRETLAKLLKRPRTRPGSSTPVVIAEEFIITGVLRAPTREELRDRLVGFRDDVDVLLPAATATDLFFRFPGNREMGVNSVTVRVDSEDNVKEVDRRIGDMGLESFAPVKILEQVRFNVLMISLATSFVALVALVVAGLGIANTLLMSVLERTHEIGVMKAVGARERHIQLLFLVEGAFIGLAGSGLGLLSAWLASYPLDRLARRLAERQSQVHLTQSLLIFPWWLMLGVPLFVTVLTMLAAAYPARRAARINPMTALRHE
jgi:putative ABC transport system permease protein